MANEITTRQDIENIKINYGRIYERKVVALIAICNYYAGLCLKSFREKQAHNQFWTNQTGNLFNNAFSDSMVAREFIGFFLSLKENYGLYVELANDRKHEAVRPIVMSFYYNFIEDIRKIYAD